MNRRSFLKALTGAAASLALTYPLATAVLEKPPEPPGWDRVWRFTAGHMTWSSEESALC